MSYSVELGIHFASGKTMKTKRQIYSINGIEVKEQNGDTNMQLGVKAEGIYIGLIQNLIK